MRVNEYRIKGYDTLTREVKGKDRPSAIIHVPKSLAGRRVMVILLDDPDEPISSEK